MNSDGRLSQDELRDSAIRAYNRNIAKTREDAEISQLNIPLSRDLLKRLRKHPSPFSCYIDVINAVGEEGSQEFAPPELPEADAVEHANTLWRRKPQAERDDIIHDFEKRIRDEEKDLPGKDGRVRLMLAGRRALAERKPESRKPAEGARAQEPAKQSSLAERFLGATSFLRKFRK
ncbi:MAG: hypothetical protein WCX64_06300 [Candidatus Micrarchaeia archaeon]